MILEKTHKLVLYNDDKNDYLFIIACLVRYCDHDIEQAEQCAVIAHNKGSYPVKSGSFIDMLELHQSLSILDVKTEIEEYASDLY